MQGGQPASQHNQVSIQRHKKVIWGPETPVLHTQHNIVRNTTGIFLHLHVLSKIQVTTSKQHENVWEVVTYTPYTSIIIIIIIIIIARLQPLLDSYKLYTQGH